MNHSVPGSFRSLIFPDRWQRWGPRRRLSITRIGWYYLGFTIVVGLAAMNTGNNLLFLLLGLLLSGIVISGVLSEQALRRLTVERVLPTDPQVDQPCLVGVRVMNGKSRQTTYAIIVRDVAETGEAGRSFMLSILPGRSREVSYQWTPARRGALKFIRVDLGTRFPFGIFEKWRECDVEADTVVLPREVPAPVVLPRRAVPFGETPTRAAGMGTEFFALRDIRPGDDARSIHWRTSARRGHPVVVDREREQRRKIAVVVDNRPGTLGPEKSDAAFQDRLDRLAEGGAALVRKALREDCEVSLTTSDAASPSGFGSSHERRLLRMLAVMGPSTAATPPVATGRDVVMIEARAVASEELPA